MLYIIITKNKKNCQVHKNIYKNKERNKNLLELGGLGRVLLLIYFNSNNFNC